MPNPNLPESELLKSLLEPMLDDLNYWFERSANLLETEEIGFLSQEEQSDLLGRVQQAQQELRAAQALFQATGGQVGIETAALMPWHRLLAECWQVSARFRSLRSGKPGK
jgi:Zn ribbon nucleic-acid-binding protein